MVSSPAFNVSMLTFLRRSFPVADCSSSLARLVLPMLLLMELLLGLCVLLRFGLCHKVRCKTLLFVLRSYPGLGFPCPGCLGKQQNIEPHEYPGFAHLPFCHYICEAPFLPRHSFTIFLLHTLPPPVCLLVVALLSY